MDEQTQRLAFELFGAIPAGEVFGMPIMIDPRMPDDRFRIVDPVSGRYSDFPFTPHTPPA